MAVFTTDADGLAAAIEAIRAGEPVVMPTDTVYGLGVQAGDPDALDRLFQLKRRPRDRSVAVLVASVEQATTLAHLNDHEQAVGSAFWPGALTLVLQRLDTVHASVGRDDGTVGVRCPGHDFVRQLAEAVGPLATTSANLSGEITPVEARAAAEALDGGVAVVIDGGPCEGQASTVARVDADGQVNVFREGSVSQADLEAAVQNR